MTTLHINFEKPLPILEDVAAKSNTSKTVQIGEDVFVSPEEHETLLQHCKDLLDWSDRHREGNVARYTRIDKELSGFIKLDDEDAQRKEDTENGMGPKPYPVYLQLTKTQLDEAMTYLLSVFFPEEGPYAATAPADKQDVAKAFTALMNSHSSTFQHYRHFAKFGFDALRYNVGFMGVEWKEVFGTAVTNDTAQNLQLETNRLLHAGNALEYFDPYNTLVDPSVSPVDLAEKGEFFATVEVKSAFRLRRELRNSKIFNTNAEFLGKNTPARITYYKTKPTIVFDNAGGKPEATDWVRILTASSGKDGKFDSIGMFEEVKIRVWLDPVEMKLAETGDYSIWELRILNGTHIIDAKQLKNAHGMLPIVSARLWDDNFDNQTTSFGELLMPYQRFASFQMNLHQYAARKALYGVTAYDERVFPSLKNADMACSKIPFKSTLEQIDVNKALKQFFDAPNTDNTLRDIETMDVLMQKMLPTDLLKQVANLERATMYQSAATVQSGNRRNLKIAQLLDAQAFDKCRRMEMYNILEKQETMEMIDSKTGESIEINPAAFRDTKIEFIIGAGLRGMDKLILIELMQTVLNSLLQNPQAAQAHDITAIIDYITTLVGDYTNFAQFKFKSEFDKLAPEEKQMAFELLQQAMQQQAQAKGVTDASRTV